MRFAALGGTVIALKCVISGISVMIGGTSFALIVACFPVAAGGSFKCKIERAVVIDFLAYQNLLNLIDLDCYLVN